MSEKQRVIQEYIPGKQITLAHIIANPSKSVYKKMGLSAEHYDAIGILTITPPEGSIIASDLTKGQAEQRFFLQGRDENNGIFIPQSESILYGTDQPRLLK